MNIKYLFPFLIFTILVSACSKQTIITEDEYKAVDLPDGSIVFLNQNSELEYVESFNERKVAIKGECYFSIVESDKPFTVQGELGIVEVLGTEFNLKSDSENMEVEVEEGEVSLSVEGKSEKVARGQMASYDKGNKSIKTGKAPMSFKKWMSKMTIELKKFDQKFNKEIKELEKIVKDKSKEADKEAKKVGKELEDVGKQIGKSLKKITN
ncbi:FecR family protein [Marivirga arenosa]|uniref:FecR family protein n=1 Tax=Marivirga arenosa TaxID=3059076 RepID=A0AA49GGZ3_9BACT|nr:FecR family protein [Marivirga sp. BKB1-2]WKK81633.1 FecR family protein [Marivirga sp. BKB1-2]